MKLEGGGVAGNGSDRGGSSGSGGDPFLGEAQTIGRGSEVALVKEDVGVELAEEED